MAIYIISSFTSTAEKIQKSKESQKKSQERGTNDLLYTDKAVTSEVMSRKKNLTMAWKLKTLLHGS